MLTKFMIVGVLRFTLDEFKIECHGKRAKKGIAYEAEFTKYKNRL